jgi:Phospholipase_D-nuclease N-terminal
MAVGFPTDVATLAYTPGTGLAAAALAVWIFVWLLVAVRVVRRRDLGFAGKLLWLVVILVVPFIGLFVYFLWEASRPGRA